MLPHQCLLLPVQASHPRCRSWAHLSCIPAGTPTERARGAKEEATAAAMVAREVMQAIQAQQGTQAALETAEAEAAEGVV